MSLLNKRLFGTNGIRGVFGKDLSIEVLINIAFSIGSFFGKGPIILGHDGRSSSLAILKIISSVLLSTGIDVYTMGLTPTPCLQFTVKNSKFSGGIMITASHNPPEYNGLKPISNQGIEISREQEKIIEDIYYHKKFLKNQCVNFGNLFNLDDVVEKYVDKVLSLIDTDAVKKHEFKIVMDLGNGVQSIVAPVIAKKLGCDILIINGHIDPNFSARGSEPTMDNLNNLTEMVKKTSADLGVAYDGDGDRSIFCDEKGVIHWGDKTGSILAYYLIKYKRLRTSVVCPINSSLIISRICELLNTKLFFTNVGSVEVTYEMKDTDSLIGFEENGGFFYGLLNQVRDGAITTALILEMMGYYKQNLLDDEILNRVKTDKILPSLSSIYSLFDNTYQHKSSLKVSDTSTISKVIALCKDHGSPIKIESIDGIKIWFDSDSWIMFRPSGTEPLIRIYAESDDKSLLDSKVKEYLNLIKDYLVINENKT